MVIKVENIIYRIELLWNDSSLSCRRISGIGVSIFDFSNLH